MSSSLDYRNRFLCVFVENGIEAKEWYPVREADRAEVQILCGRPVTKISSAEGIYVDEEGNVFQLMDKGETKAIEVEHLPGTGKPEVEVLPKASSNGRKTNGQNGESKRMQRKNRNNGRIQQAPQIDSSPPESLSPETTANAHASADSRNGAASDAPVQLNLRQKLAEVRRRISYIQKRGHNERFNYSYVTAADIAGAVGDALAELEVVVIPRLESISHENISPNQGYPDHLTRVVMTYTFMDVNSAEELTVKMPGEGRDPGDKGPYKAMTGALKYALLQSFLIATGDDPEDERADGGPHAGGNGNGGSDPVISQEQAGQIYELIEKTGTDVAKMLEYFKISKIEEMTVSVYGRAVQALKRKQATAANQGAAHA
jgi:hypothetical protein